MKIIHALILIPTLTLSSYLQSDDSNPGLVPLGPLGATELYQPCAQMSNILGKSLHQIGEVISSTTKELLHPDKELVVLDCKLYGGVDLKFLGGEVGRSLTKGEYLKVSSRIPGKDKTPSNNKIIYEHGRDGTTIIHFTNENAAGLFKLGGSDIGYLKENQISYKDGKQISSRLRLATTAKVGINAFPVATGVLACPISLGGRFGAETITATPQGTLQTEKNGFGALKAVGGPLYLGCEVTFSQIPVTLETIQMRQRLGKSIEKMCELGEINEL